MANQKKSDNHVIVTRPVGNIRRNSTMGKKRDLSEPRPNDTVKTFIEMTWQVLVGIIDEFALITRSFIDRIRISDH